MDNHKESIGPARPTGSRNAIYRRLRHLQYQFGGSLDFDESATGC